MKFMKYIYLFTKKLPDSIQCTILKFASLMKFLVMSSLNLLDPLKAEPQMYKFRNHWTSS